MSYFLQCAESVIGKLLAEDAIPRVMKVSGSNGDKPLVQYMHLDNYADIVALKLNPLDYTGFSIQHFVGFSVETQTRILEAILKHNPPKTAAEYAGVSWKKLQRWVELGEQGVEPFAGFFQECIRATAMAKMSMTEQALEGMKGKSEAARWWLEKMDVDHFGRQTAVHIENNITNNTANFMALKPKERNALIESALEQVDAGMMWGLIRSDPKA